MHRRHVAGRALAVLAATLAAATLLATGPVHAAEDPEVRSTVSQDFVTIPDDPDPPVLATLHLPTGRWVVWAVVGYGVFEEWKSARVTCWTTMRSSTELDRHTVRVREHPMADHETPGSIGMSVAARITHPRGARVGVRCRSHGELVVARSVRIAAMRAGRLTTIGPHGTTSSGSGAPHVIQLRQAAGLAVPTTSGTQTLVTMELDAGVWSIRAHINVDADHDLVSSSAWRCRLALGTAVDKVDGLTLDAAFERDRNAATMEVAARITGPDSLRLGCGVDWGVIDARLRQVRITAIPAGLLSLGDGSEGGTWTSTGSGRPRVIHARLATSGPVSDREAWAPVARVPLTGGRWLMAAKFRTGDEEDGLVLYCRLRQEDGVSPVTATTKAWGDGIPLQLVGTVDRRRGMLWLECKWDEHSSGVAHLSRVRITAVRIR